MIAITALCLIIAILLASVRAFLGPSAFDRVLAFNAIGTKCVLLISVLGFILGRPEYLDLGLFYVFINFVMMIAFFKVFRYRSFQLALAKRKREPLI